MKDQTQIGLNWCKQFIEDPSSNLFRYLIKNKKVAVSQEEQIISKVIGLMEKSKFQPKMMTDLRRQVKQQTKTAFPDQTNDQIEKLTDLIIQKLDDSWIP